MARNPPHSPSETSTGRLHARATTGFASPAQDYHEPPLSLDELLNLQAPHIFLMRANGQELSAIGIFHGDLLIIDRSLQAVPGQLIVAEINGDLMVRLLDSKAGRPVLHTPGGRPPYFLLEGETLQLWGVVTHSLHQLPH